MLLTKINKRVMEIQLYDTKKHPENNYTQSCKTTVNSRLLILKYYE